MSSLLIFLNEIIITSSLSCVLLTHIVLNIYYCIYFLSFIVTILYLVFYYYHLRDNDKGIQQCAIRARIIQILVKSLGACSFF
jgi:hypothetical protein